MNPLAPVMATSISVRRYGAAPLGPLESREDRKVLKEFKEFLTKGNLIEIAVGLILALAFKAVVDSVVNDIFTPIIAAIFGQPDFARMHINVGDSAIFYGRFINALISFVIIGFVLFLVMKIYNAVRRDTPPPEPDEDIILLREIRDSMTNRAASYSGAAAD